MNPSELRGKYHDALTPSDEFAEIKKLIREHAFCQIPMFPDDDVEVLDLMIWLKPCYICGSVPGVPTEQKKFCSRCGREP